MSNYIKTAEQEFEQALEHLAKDFKNLRTNRANASLVEDIHVQAYGSSMELKGVASITTPDAKTIQIEPWDKNVVKDIEKALIASGIGIMPRIAGTVIHLNMPPMTEENRREIVKVVGQKAELTRISIRNMRENVREQIIKDEKSKTISEDERFNLQEELDKAVTKVNDRIEAMAKEKEAEVMAI